MHGAPCFGVNINGGEFANLHHFTGGSDGGAPRGLIEFENRLYGTSTNGGSSGRGTVFQVTTSSGGFSVLYSFTAQSASQPYTNTDGAEPKAGLVVSGRTLYGTASQGEQCRQRHHIQSVAAAFLCGLGRWLWPLRSRRRHRRRSGCRQASKRCGIRSRGQSIGSRHLRASHCRCQCRKPPVPIFARRFG